MGRNESVARLKSHLDNSINRQRPLILEDLSEILALYVLHQEVNEACFRILLVRGEPHDVSRLRSEPLHDSRFSQEARAGGVALRATQSVDPEDLERFDPPTGLVANLVYRTERACPDSRQDAPFVPNQGADKGVVRIRIRVSRLDLSWMPCHRGWQRVLIRILRFGHR